MNLTSVINVYKRYAPVYDVFFGKVFEEGRNVLHQKMQCTANHKVLEVGIGTGISLIDYPQDTQVTGIDISPEMLAQAEQKVAEHNRKNVTLHIMDAESMSFADNSFDKIALMYVATVVPNPQKMMNEVRRVCKPGGQILILNHFSDSKKWMRPIELLLSPLANILGWEANLSINDFIRDNRIQVVSRQSVNFLGLWTVLEVRNDK
jgi:phosphatidylethanolamine/phosphatidyl-N-methylethanolamine N-methyltransferase